MANNVKELSRIEGKEFRNQSVKSFLADVSDSQIVEKGLKEGKTAAELVKLLENKGKV